MDATTGSYDQDVCAALQREELDVLEVRATLVRYGFCLNSPFSVHLSGMPLRRHGQRADQA